MKTFLIHLHRGNLVVPPEKKKYRNGFDLFGYSFVIHRPHLSDYGWCVSEYRYGLGCNVIGVTQTINGTINVAKNRLRRLGKKKFEKMFKKYIKKWGMKILNR